MKDFIVLHSQGGITFLLNKNHIVEVTDYRVTTDVICGFDNMNTNYSEITVYGDVYEVSESLDEIIKLLEDK